MKSILAAGLCVIGFASATEQNFVSQHVQDPLSCGEDVIEASTGISAAIDSFKKGTYMDVSDGIIHLGEAIQGLGKGLKDCESTVSDKEAEVSHELIKQGAVLANTKSIKYSPLEKKLIVNGVNVFDEFSAAVLAADAGHNDVASMHLFEASQKIYDWVNLHPELCYCDETYEFLVGFVNNITPVINTERVLPSLSTKAKNYTETVAEFMFGAGADDVFSAPPDIARWADATLHLMYAMRQDKAFVEEFNEVSPYLQCMLFEEVQITPEQLQLFQKAGNAYTDITCAHSLTAGIAMGQLAQSMCQG